MAQNLLRLRRAIPTLHRALYAISSLPHSSPFSSLSSCAGHPSPASKIQRFQFQARSFRSSSISLAKEFNFNPNEEIGPDTILFEGCDYNHWLIVMDYPRDNRPPAEEMIRNYEETCAKGLNISVEEAKKKIYACSTSTYTGFQVLMSEEESEKFNEVPGVIFVLPDSYIDPENKQYGGDKYENGEIIPRPPPFQYESRGSRYRDRNRYDRSDQQRNPPFVPPGDQFRAPQQGPQQTYGQLGQGENRGQPSVNSPPGRDAYQPGRDTMPSYQGNFNQQAQRNIPQGGQSTYTPPSQVPNPVSYGQGPRPGSYGQGPSTGSYGQGPNSGTYGQGPSTGSYGQGLSAGSYGQGPSTGSYGQGASGGSYGQGASGGSYGQGPSSGSYGQSPSNGSYGQGPSAGRYGQGPSAGSYGQGPIAGAQVQGPGSGYPAPGDQNFTQGEPKSMQGESRNYAPMGQNGTDRGRY